MARPLRPEFPHAVYHLTSRGNARQKIFRNDEDRIAFLKILAQVVDRFGWISHAYCLMENHYHLLIETPQANLSRGMRQLNGTYTQAFNREHRRGGHLFQGRFQAILVEKEAHLLELCRYIVLNPVRARLVKTPGQWSWSSFLATAGKAPVPDFLTVGWVLENFGSYRKVAQRRYEVFVGEGKEVESPWPSLKGQIYLGSDRFVARHQPDAVLSEIPRRQTQAVRPGLALLFSKKRSQDEALILAYRRYGYRLGEIGEFLGVHYSTVSRYLKRAECRP